MAISLNRKDLKKTQAALLKLLALFILTLPALHPFLLGQMPLTDDGTLHLYRTIALDYSLQHDHPLYPRYSSALVYGYGAPLFNYFPPVSYYLPRTLHVLGLSFVQSWLMAMAGYIFIGAVGAYLAGCTWARATGGFVTAAAYTYAPYIVFDSVTRGTLSEVAALAALPWAMWAMTRLAQSQQRRYFLLTVATLAVFIPIHNIVTLYGIAFLAGYGLILWLTNLRRDRLFVMLLMAGIAAVLMTAFFWLPALAERDYVKIDAVTQNLPFIDVTNSLRDVGDVLSLPRTADPTRLQAPVPITLGWPQIGLAAAALVLIWSIPDIRLRTVSLYLAGVVALLVFLNLEASAYLWQSVPLIGYTQFAWRVLGVASLALAVLSGIGASLLLRRDPRKWPKIAFFTGSLIVLVVYAIPWLYTPYIEIQAEDIQDAQQHERRTGELALSSYAEYLPAWTDPATLDPGALQDRFAHAEAVTRLSLPDGVTISDHAVEMWTGTQAIVPFRSDSPAALVFDWLYVPGWRARFLEPAFSDVPLTVYPTSGQGLVGVEVPAGTYTLQVSLEATSIQQLAWLLSLIGVFLIILTTYIIFRRAAVQRDIDLIPGDSLDRVSAAPLIYAMIVVGTGLFLLKAGWLDHSQSVFRTTRYVDGTVTGVSPALDTNFGGQIRLLGTTGPEAVKNGEIARFRLFWGLSGERVDVDYSTKLELQNADGVVVAEAGSFQPGGLATSNWLPGFYVEEEVELAIPSTLPPGMYTLQVGVYQPDTGRQLDILNPAGDPTGVRQTLIPVRVQRAGDPLPDGPTTSPASDHIPYVDDVDAPVVPVADAFLTRLPTQATAGDSLLIDWTWFAVQDPDAVYLARPVWLRRGEVLAAAPTVPLTAGFPTSEWQQGEMWQGLHRLHVPGDLPEGTYQVAVQVLAGDGSVITRTEPLKEMYIDTPDRSYELPQDMQLLDVAWSNGIVLRGYRLLPDRAGVEFIWQTEAMLTTSLRLFVQKIDASGRILALTDRIPANWDRPTTGWIIGEVVITTHELPIDPEGATFRIGWYLPQSGERVLTVDGGDHFRLQIP